MENPFPYQHLTGYDKVVALQYHRLADFLIKFVTDEQDKQYAMRGLMDSYSFLKVYAERGIVS